MSSISFSLLSLSLLYVLQTVNYIALESAGALLLSPLLSGIAAVGIPGLSALCVVTKPARDDAITASVVFTLCAFWTSLGLSDISKELTPQLSENFTSETFPEFEVLLPGHGVLVFLFAIFSICLLLYNHQKELVVLTTLSCLSSACLITNMWTDLKGRSLTFVSLAFIAVYISVRRAVNSFIKGTSELKMRNKFEFDNKRVIRYFLNALSLSPWLLSSFTSSDNSSAGFIWPLSSGIFLIIYGVNGLRWGNVDISTCSIIDGLFWTSLGGNMYIKILKQYSDIFFPSVSVPASLIVLMLAFLFLHEEILLSLQYVFLTALILAIAFDSKHIPTSVLAWACFILNVYGYITVLCKSFSFKIRFPVGENGLEEIRYRLCAKKPFWSNKVGADENDNSKNVFESDSMLGFSKYASLECLGYIANIISVLAFIWVPQGVIFLSLPWEFTYGCCVQFVVGFVCFSRGQTFEASSFLIFASFWSIWGSLRSLDLFRTDLGMSLGAGISGFMLVGVLFLGLSITVNRTWTSIFVCFDLLVLSTLLQTVGVNDGYIVERVGGVALSLSFLYAFLSSAIKMSFGKELLPLGRPLQQVNKIQKHRHQILSVPARKARGVKEIAETLKSGGICGVPSDTVYILVACCNQPKAVERAYKTKKQAEDRPMSVWISNFQQIESARQEFGDLLWDFLHEIWPSNVSVVVKRGNWVKSLGLGDSEQYVGRPDSIALRIPDSTITCHLIDQSGPVTVTSANPTGEGDTTHHLQVLAKLGMENCDGILCDGPSRENAISTVVDCRDIDNGNLAFFRIGLTPKSTVLVILNKLLKKHKKTPENSTTDSTNNVSSNNHVNHAFESENKDE